ncbi:uncharacterized protein FYW23_015164 isoform 1-T2 [Sylvia borin]
MPRLTLVKRRKRKEEKDDDKSPAPAQQPEEVEVIQPLQAAEKLPKKKKHTHRRLHKNAQKIFLDFHKPIDHNDNTITAPGGMGAAESYKAEDCAATQDVIKGNGTSKLKKVSCLRQGLVQPAYMYILKLSLLVIQQTTIVC